MNITYKAPGKIILSGEHSVVYAKPALVTAIDLCLTCTVSTRKDRECKTHGKELNDGVNIIDKSVTNYLREKNIKHEIVPYDLKIVSQIPVGRGMGSSAALCVSLSAALSHLYTGHPLSKEQINTIAYRAEKHFHGNPSGVDVSASCFGGLIFFRKEFEFLKNISALHMKIPAVISQNLVILDTGKPEETTAEMVAIVGSKFNKDPINTETTLFKMEKITKRMVVAVAKEDPRMFEDSIYQNQLLLRELGVVSHEADKILADLSPAGYGKISGAGGSIDKSGLILFYIKNREEFENVIKIKKIKIIPFRQQFRGVEEVGSV